MFITNQKRKKVNFLDYELQVSFSKKSPPVEMLPIKPIDNNIFRVKHKKRSRKTPAFRKISVN